MSDWYKIPGDETTPDDRESLIDAALAQLMQEAPELWTTAGGSLASFRDALVELTHTLPEYPKATHWLLQAVEAAAGRIAVEKQINIFGDYEIRYGVGVSGPRTLSITDNRLDYAELRIGGSEGVPTSLSLSLLVGELFEGQAERLLLSLELGATSVESVRPLREARRRQGGRRIDDWLLATSDGREVPVEVKATRSFSYLQRSFGQLEAALGEVEEALLVGILYETRKILVLRVTSPFDAAAVRRALEELARVS